MCLIASILDLRSLGCIYFICPFVKETVAHPKHIQVDGLASLLRET